MVLSNACIKKKKKKKVLSVLAPDVCLFQTQLIQGLPIMLCATPDSSKKRKQPF